LSDEGNNEDGAVNEYTEQDRYDEGPECCVGRLDVRQKGKSAGEARTAAVDKRLNASLS
jgi:hypothetical protein